MGADKEIHPPSAALLFQGPPSPQKVLNNTFKKMKVCMAIWKIRHVHPHICTHLHIPD